MDRGLLFVSLLLFAIGAWWAVFPERRTGRTNARISVGDDRYFEEQRAYRSYPSLRDPKIVRNHGFAMIAMSAVGGTLAFVLV